METNVTINTEQRLFIIPCGSGYTCLGFDVCHEWTARRVEWLQKQGVTDFITELPERGTQKAYALYTYVSGMVAGICRTRKIRADFDLSPQLIGLEGRRVEVTDMHGETRRFNVGKSLGPIPVHLEVKTRRSLGGAAADREYKSVRIIR